MQLDQIRWDDWYAIEWYFSSLNILSCVSIWKLPYNSLLSVSKFFGRIITSTFVCLVCHHKLSFTLPCVVAKVLTRDLVVNVPAYVRAR